MGIDDNTNNFSELVAVWACLFWAKRLGIRDIQNFGDSHVVIDWINLKTGIHSIYLQHWCTSIRDLLTYFTGTSFRHIFCENNQDVDRLSKRGLGKKMGSLYFEELSGSSVIKADNFQMYWRSFFMGFTHGSYDISQLHCYILSYIVYFWLLTCAL